jgi:hypothetical protein
VSPVTYSVHWVGCSFVGNHERITIYVSPAIAGPKILTLFCLFWTEILAVTVTNAKVFSSEAGVTRHLNSWSDYYSKVYGSSHINLLTKGMTLAKGLASYITAAPWAFGPVLATRRPSVDYRYLF